MEKWSTWKISGYCNSVLGMLLVTNTLFFKWYSVYVLTTLSLAHTKKVEGGDNELDNVERSMCGLIYTSVPESAWRDWVRPWHHRVVKCLSQDLNQAPLEYKSQALLFQPSCTINEQSMLVTFCWIYRTFTYDETSQDMHCMYNVTLKHVCVTIVAMQKQ